MSHFLDAMCILLVPRMILLFFSIVVIVVVFVVVAIFAVVVSLTFSMMIVNLTFFFIPHSFAKRHDVRASVLLIYTSTRALSRYKIEFNALNNHFSIEEYLFVAVMA